MRSVRINRVSTFANRKTLFRGIAERNYGVKNCDIHDDDKSTTRDNYGRIHPKRQQTNSVYQSVDTLV